MSYDTKTICLFGAPGSGKTTTAMELTARLKKAGLTAEYVTEAAKDIVHEGANSLFQYQDWISAEQNRRQLRLVGKYEYIVTDSPILLGIFYVAPDYYPSYKQLVLEKHHSYDNINFYLHRNHPYEAIGRYQDEDGAHQLGLQIHSYLRHEQYPMKEIHSNGLLSPTDQIFMSIMDARAPNKVIAPDTSSW